MKKLDGKIAIVTGAAMGNGFGAAAILAKHGAHVVLTDIQEKIFISAKEIAKKNTNVCAYKMDVTDYENVKFVVSKVKEKYGRVDILVNNAGVNHLVGFLNMDNEIRDKIFKVNIEGVWNCSKVVLPYMVDQKYGKVINISSVTGPIVVDFGQTAYACTKGAVLAFTKALAIEFAQYNITVNAICPGYILTPMVDEGARETNYSDPQSVIKKIAERIPMGRLGNIFEMGEVVAFLSSDESSYITGTQIVIDGGSTLPETSGAMGVS